MSRLRITLEEDGVKGELIDGTGVVRSERIPFNDEELVETQAAALTVPTLFTFLQRLLDSVQLELPRVEEVLPVVWSYSATLSFDADRSPQPSSPTTLTGPAPSAHPPPPFPRTISLADALSRLLALSTAPLDTQDSDPASVIDKVERYSSCKTGSYWSKRYDEFRPRLLFHSQSSAIPSSLHFHSESTPSTSQTRSPTYVSTSSLDSLVVPISEESIDTFGLPGGTVVRFENQAWWVWEDTRHAGVRIALRDRLANGKWSQFDQTIGILPPGGTLGLDDKAFMISSGRPIPQQSISDPPIRFEGGQPVGSFRDPRADIRCVVESQAFALADVLDMLDLGDLITDTLIVRADWMGPSTLRLFAQVTGISIVPYPLTETGPNSLSSPTASDQTHTPTPLTPPSHPTNPSLLHSPAPSSGPSSPVGFASNTLSEPSQKIMAAHDLPTPVSSPIHPRPPCRIPLETASQEGNDVSTAPCYLPPLMMQLGSWESTLYPALREEYRRLRDIADRGLVRRPLPSPPCTLPPSPLPKTMSPLERRGVPASRSMYD
ncbi:hypothetical protein DB88DRAFT_544328 [Papiliotrema laurentii]|uniref:Uncharacterized protein n=1 Tax=Papiliotrema laurentii TaxID=5418 RepID=A0AAD9FTI2_PAPLA|nr:hypothetical protein DB88DRAFT_544328 [Papiliotrema laurentii]